MLVSAFVLLVIAALLAQEQARRGRGHDVRAWLLGAEAVSLVVQAVIATQIGEGPYTGASRLGFHVQQTLFIAWPAGVAALAVCTLARATPWPILIVFLIVSGALVGGYPGLRGERLESVLGLWHLSCVAIGLVSIAEFVWRRGRPRAAHVLAIMLVAGEVLVAVEPYRRGIFAAWLPSGAICYALIYGSLCAVQAAYLWGARPSQLSRS